MTQVDDARLGELVGRVLGDLGGAFSVPLVRIGDELGLYRALRDTGPSQSRIWPPPPAARRDTCANGCRRRLHPAM